MAEPRQRHGPLQVHVDYLFDRLHDSKLSQAYSLLVPVRERPVGGSVKEFEHEDGGALRTGVVRAAAGGEHDKLQVPPLNEITDIKTLQSVVLGLEEIAGPTQPHAA